MAHAVDGRHLVDAVGLRVLRFAPHVAAHGRDAALNTSALFSPLLAVVFAGKRERWTVWMGVLVGFFGVVAVLRPGSAMFQPMSLVGLLSGLLMALRVFLNSQLGDEPKAAHHVLFAGSGSRGVPAAVRGRRFSRGGRRLATDAVHAAGDRRTDVCRCGAGSRRFGVGS